jgi:hypothetical protein
MKLKAPKAVQLDSIDADLRVGLWNVVILQAHALLDSRDLNIARFGQGLTQWVWTDFLKQSITAMRPGFHLQWQEIEAWFHGSARRWYELFDFVEFLGRSPYDDSHSKRFTDGINHVLERENSGYRYINGKIAPITNPAEVAAVQQAATPATNSLKPVSMHIQQALELLSDRDNPDYRNSMKESISAVESLCKMVANLPKATLGPALDKTAKELDLNDHLRDGMKLIYRYTSDDHGIRHGLKDDGQPEREDAQFLLINCSAFVNFVTEKARKLGKLPK